MAENIRVVVAHASLLFRQCISAILAVDEKLSIVDTAIGEDLVELIRKQDARLLLIDYDGARQDVLDLMRSISGSLPQVKIVLLGMPETREIFLKCIEAGAHGYVSREGSVADLVKTIEAVIRDEAHCSPQLTLSLFGKLAEFSRQFGNGTLPLSSPLTFRQLEIVRMIADGLSNKQIARKLRLSLFTVKNHVHNILRLLDVEDRREAVKHAQQQRWISKTSNSL